MEIKEAVDEKKKLELAITKLIDEFNEKTGLSVHNVFPDENTFEVVSKRTWIVNCYNPFGK